MFADCFENCIDCKEEFEIMDNIQYRCPQCQAKYRINQTEEDIKAADIAKQYNRIVKTRNNNLISRNTNCLP